MIQFTLFKLSDKLSLFEKRFIVKLASFERVLFLAFICSYKALWNQEVSEFLMTLKQKH